MYSKQAGAAGQKPFWPYHRNEKYPPKLKTNWRNVKVATLRRYIRFHNINVRHDCTPAEYSIAVARHFGSRHKVHVPQVLHKFMATVQQKNRSNSTERANDLESWRNVYSSDVPGGSGHRGGGGAKGGHRRRRNRNGGDKAEGKRKRSKTSERQRKEDSKKKHGTSSSNHSSTNNNNRSGGNAHTKRPGDYTGNDIEVFWGPPHNRWFKATVKDFNVTKEGFSTLIYRDNSEEYAQLLPGGLGKALGDAGVLEAMKWRIKRSGTPDGNGGGARGASVVISQSAYKDMVKRSLRALGNEGTFKDICSTMQKLFDTEIDKSSIGDARKTPVWKSSVRKILYAHPEFKRMKGPGASGAHIFSVA
eukprot:g1107.t1